MRLNLGCGADVRVGWVNVDQVAGVGIDLVGDISRPETFRALADDSVSAVEMSHILEHIQDPLPMMQELWRVAKDGCQLLIRVPHGAHDMAFSDPQHVRQYFPSSFQFFAQPCYTRAHYGYWGDWETDAIELRLEVAIEPDDPNLMFYITNCRNYVGEMAAVLRAVKPMRPAGSQQWTFNPQVTIT